MKELMNLDYYAARASQNIINSATAAFTVEKIENLVTKALGVLQEQGVYACMLYLLSRSSEEIDFAKKVVVKELIGLIRHARITSESPPAQIDFDRDILSFINEEISKDLDILFLTRDIWEQTFIYARFGAKARKKRA